MLLALGAIQGAVAQEPTDDEIKQQIIRQSIARYSGNCPCPYNSASNGSRCGKRSAYSRPGGASPTCYPGDVSVNMIEQWRRRN
ncbi:hypothetical protein [Cobetia sp. 4B]|uniref:hypothetical protein n=1 Tax=Cobetia sp. 4B TaxID=2758724 RepID=UPI001F0B2968|nr:hypothetical protein [Cobetia sp. 4B]